MTNVDAPRIDENEELRAEAISPTFCILPWIHLSTRPNGHLRLCCTANASSVGATQDKKYGGEVGILKNENGRPANLNKTDLLSAWNNQYMRDVRQMMLRGDIPASCLKCFKEEEAGHRSKRNWETEYWSKRVSLRHLVEATDEDGSVPPTITYVDLRLGTKCNLKCVMCSPHDSSLWVGDWNRLYPQIENPELKDLMQWRNKGKVDGATYNWHVDNQAFWDQLYDQLPNMRQLYFAGGEATIIEEHYTLLEECIRRGHANHIELRYNSNGIEIPDRLLELWNHFQRVRFHFSIDSLGAMNDYIRHPSQWKDIEAQLRRLDATPDNIEVTIACAIQVLNIFYLPDFIKWKLEQKYRKINPWPLGAGLINVHLVYHPAHLNIKVLPPEFKEKVAKKYEEFYGWLEDRFAGDQDFFASQYGISRLKGLIRFMKAEDWSRRMPQLREYIRLMDGIRGTNFNEVFPEMAELLEGPA
ncbi:MAG: twitch domain-containing radical SAM protein [Bdellovibrionaceae bacterium]|nr:twitch domain-containing radical SAM protein [Pseudobdellovibrionaceae bacterium]